MGVSPDVPIARRIGELSAISAPHRARDSAFFSTLAGAGCAIGIFVNSLAAKTVASFPNRSCCAEAGREQLSMPTP